MFCIDFEDEEDLVFAGADHPWVLNDGVQIVPKASAGCPQGDKCGYFENSRLEIPFFSNAYSGINSLRITFWLRRVDGEPVTMGLISNDCFNGVQDAAGNSLYCSIQYDGDNLDYIEAGVRDPLVFANIVRTQDILSFVTTYSVYQLRYQYQRVYNFRVYNFIVYKLKVLDFTSFRVYNFRVYN